MKLEEYEAFVNKMNQQERRKALAYCLYLIGKRILYLLILAAFVVFGIYRECHIWGWVE